MSRNPKRTSGRNAILLLGFCLAGAVSSAKSQGLVRPEHVPQAVAVLNNAPQKGSLPCKLWIEKRARLDFLFRYNAGFSAECRLGMLRQGDVLRALIRVTPEGHSPVILAEKFDVPRISPEQLTRFYSASLNQLWISMGGGFALGPGRYSAEVLLTDEEGRTYRKHRKLNVESGKNAANVPLTLAPYSVAPLVLDWQRKRTSNGLRTTILFHADSPGGAARIYDWRITDLLQSLTTMLDEMPCESVKLVAFNLDRQTEVFRQDEFDAEGLDRLKKTLAQMELVTIPYQALMKQSWQKFLVNLAQRETVQAHPEAVIILGEGGSHAWDKLPQDLVDETIGTPDARFFYFKYYSPAGPRDGLETLMKRLHGRTFDIHSPETLGRAITNMLKDLGYDARRGNPEPAP